MIGHFLRSRMTRRTRDDADDDNNGDAAAAAAAADDDDDVHADHDHRSAATIAPRAIAMNMFKPDASLVGQVDQAGPAVLPAAPAVVPAAVTVLPVAALARADAVGALHVFVTRHASDPEGHEAELSHELLSIAESALELEILALEGGAAPAREQVRQGNPMGKTLLASCTVARVAVAPAAGPMLSPTKVLPEMAASAVGPSSVNITTTIPARPNREGAEFFAPLVMEDAAEDAIVLSLGLDGRASAFAQPLRV
jgi:hypothetical protein